MHGQGRVAATGRKDPALLLLALRYAGKRVSRISEKLCGDVTAELLGHEPRHEVLELLQFGGIGKLEPNAHACGVFLGRAIFVDGPHHLAKELKLIWLSG